MRKLAIIGIMLAIVAPLLLPVFAGLGAGKNHNDEKMQTLELLQLSVFANFLRSQQQQQPPATFIPPPEKKPTPPPPEVQVGPPPKPET